MPIQFLNGSDHNGQRAQNVGAPTASTDAATKGYVDANAGGGSSTPSPGAGRRRIVPSVGDFYSMRANNTGASGPGNGVLDLSALFLPAGTYDQVSINVTDAGSSGALVKLVGYWGVDFQAGTTLGAKAFETAAVDASTTGGKAITIPGGVVVPADSMPLWIGAVCQGAPTTAPKWTAYDTNGMYVTESVGTLVLFYASIGTFWRFTGVTGTAPVSGSAATGSRQVNGGLAGVWPYLRRSA